MASLHRSDLLSAIKSIFPELKDELNAEFGGLLSFEVEVFMRHTQMLINDGDREAVKQSFALAEKFFLDGNKDMQQVIDTCFVESLEFTDTKKRSRSWSWDLLPQCLKKAYVNFHGRSGVE